ncbi:alpha-amylase family glycosyl hydrolase [Mucilaginibacter arboris]|uniref:Alpha-amylase n=1 Tax=Mucilaginibacter arboris TaxID=2682090 RepID=A0A7K1SVX9_9SPHI|nr:alpha-amylase family glycosyl hydrolase [Mucilaginibacter arboris]MVN21397.1 alpha-amylase [Mucilaginibacter arboris]
MNKNFSLTLISFLLFLNVACKKNSAAREVSAPATTISTGIPSAAGDGVTFINSGKSAIFNLYAPGKTSVSVIGEFNNWQPTAMVKTTDGNRWWVQINNLDPAKEYAYQYFIDNSIKVADPYTEKVLDPDNDKYITADTYPNLKAYPAGATTGIVSTMFYAQPSYTWQNTSFTRPDPKNLVVYELHVRDFVAAHNYQTVKDSLTYLANLGVNAIELMPVNEFEGNSSWGYNTNFGFALDKYYGTKNAYKAFVDACHAKGIAVIQDIVLEDQFGSSPMVQMYATSSGSPSVSNPWFDAQNMHPYAVGYQLNHQSAATQYYTKNVMKYWIQEYHIDGFRFDQSKGFTQTNSTTDAAWSAYDASRVALWKTYNSYMKSLDPGVYVVLEHFAVNQEEAELAAQGMMPWANANYNANQATMGYNTDWNFQWIFYDQHGFANDNAMGYFESHDEERLQFKNGSYGNSSGSYNVKTLATGLAREEMAAAFLFSAPRPKMLWQFGELGYDISIDQNGRTGEKPIHWDYLNDANRKHLHDVYAMMIKMKTKNAVFTTTNFKYDLANAIKTVQLNGTDGVHVEVVGNFDVVAQTGNISFPAVGTWYDNISGKSISVTSLPYSMVLAPGEYHVYSNSALKQ